MFVLILFRFDGRAAANEIDALFSVRFGVSASPRLCVGAVPCFLALVRSPEAHQRNAHSDYSAKPDKYHKT